MEIPNRIYEDWEWDKNGYLQVAYLYVTDGDEPCREFSTDLFELVRALNELNPDLNIYSIDGEDSFSIRWHTETDEEFILRMVEDRDELIKELLDYLINELLNK